MCLAKHEIFNFPESQDFNLFLQIKDILDFISKGH